MPRYHARDVAIVRGQMEGAVVVLGSATMPVANLMKLGRGSVIPLERRVGEPVEVAVNGHTVARGMVVVMDEATNRFGIKLTEVLTQSPISDAAS